MKERLRPGPVLGTPPETGERFIPDLVLGTPPQSRERLRPGPIQGSPAIREAVCIQTDKVYDSCREKDCLENLRVFLTRRGQEIVDRAINVKCRKSEVIWVFPDVEAVPFNRGFFTVSVKFFFRITLDVFTGVGAPTPVEGVATFDKTVILFGSEGKARIFESKFKEDAFDPQLCSKTNLPKAKVEVVDPICLAAKLVDITDRLFETDEFDLAGVPESVSNCFDDELAAGVERKRVFVSLGLFTIIKLERNVQLLIPAFDFCIPERECIAATEDNPCELFERIRFPTDEFFPPQREDFAGAEDVFKNPNSCR
ncbi:hypothetical protein [Petroclostridium sp. X23]|uniref:hypothetical protein n=1 Tax=Petroclostridium sp. X23 TaxID=3045146 RepID=UPI0024AE4BDA|nr:hypothetical protein [Petroclostridium sp. X23]WHH59378.1 hypothetical protein QKW49_00990 [Petroclostridium sp. X23]